MGEVRKVYMVLVGKPKERRLLGRLRHTWEDGIKMTVEDWLGGCGVNSPGSG
jgi:hypothetical protein